MSFSLRQRRPLRFSLRVFFWRYHRLILLLLGLSFLETIFHIRSFRVQRPHTVLDAPFHTGCREPDTSLPRANATLLMLARNEDVDGAVDSMRSVEERFNKWFHYPVVFLNDKEWSAEFKERLGEVVSGEVRFKVIPREMWGYPEWVDQGRAGKSMKKMQENGVMYAGKESYHHMCRFNSGMFYDHPALKEYKWYWRVEPDVSFTCDITYDPFIEMEKNGKRYGYTVALWEMGTTVPTLFRKVSDYKKSMQIPTTSLWTAMMDPSYLPWPIRSLLSWSRNRDEHGDLWNMCHFWSNFEIADMDFFRSDAYRHFFEYLDADGGFYYERWGDAPVHSLAAALLLEPRELHHFADFGYRHDPFQYCPFTSANGWVPDITTIMTEEEWKREHDNAMGCNCYCDTTVAVIHPVCLNKIKATTF